MGDSSSASVRRLRPAMVAALLATVVTTVLAMAGCTKGGAKFVDPKASASDPGVMLNVTPADKATDVPVSAEIGLQNEPATLKAVTLVDGAGASVPGSLRADGSTWVPDDPLKYATGYTAKVTVDKGGKTLTRNSTFTTMQRPGNRMDSHVYMSDNAVYGQAMLIVIEFKQGGVAPADRAAVERRLFVKSDPPQTGAWHWDSNTQAEYRSKEYWQPGTKIHARMALGGLPVGGGRYGRQDITIDASIDTVRRQIEVDNQAKELTATQDDQVVKKALVSLGRPDKPSDSGTMVVMERLDKTTFDSSTYGTPVNSKDGYRTDVQYAERLTWDGQFIHAAPWSVADQGHRNVSHGCVNVSTEDGAWIYNWVKVGDPVVIKGTERHIDPGNGFTGWDLSWDAFVKGSAVAASPGPSGASSPSPNPSTGGSSSPRPSTS